MAIDWIKGLLTIFRAGDHPFAFTMERDTGNVSGVTFECENSGRVRRSDIVKLHSMVAGGGQKALIWRYAKAIDLRIGVWNCP